jgi:DnaB-like helicase N terminal domain/AAA domain
MRIDERIPAIAADEEAEKCVLGALLTGTSAIQELGADMNPRIFFYPTSRTILTAIVELHSRGVPIDIIVLTQYLREKEQLESVGGASAITELATRYNKTIAIARYELSVLRDLFSKRRLIELGRHLINAPQATGLSQLLSAAELVITDVKRVAAEGSAANRLIEFRTPSELKGFTPPPGMVLVGHCHIVKALVFVIGGAPGVGKSLSSVGLAVAGATGNEWFGLTVHGRFKTMIIQTENGPFRLSKEFGELDCEALENYVRVCLPPPFGLCFNREDFRADLCAAIDEFEPDLIILDPWNAAARDDKQKDYLDTFELIRAIIPAGEDTPALGIVAHTRKPKNDERTTGRGLLNLLAGSYVLGSVPRCVFVMQSASDDPQDNRVVWTCCKNNDGQLGERSAWQRRNGLFAPVSEFDWNAFDNPHKDDRVAITQDDMADIFENGEKQLRRAEAAKALEALTGAGRTACYNALRLDGRFSKQIGETNRLLSWRV